MGDHARLGAEIRSARVARGLSLRALAAAVGLSPSTLSLAERGGPVIGLPCTTPDCPHPVRVYSTEHSPITCRDYAAGRREEGERG